MAQKNTYKYQAPIFNRQYSILCHTVTQANMAVPAARTSLFLTFIITYPCTVSYNNELTILFF
jgi:hypothetical protein